MWYCIVLLGTAMFQLVSVYCETLQLYSVRVLKPPVSAPLFTQSKCNNAAPL